MNTMLMPFLSENWPWLLSASLALLGLTLPQLISGAREKTISEAVLAMNREHAVILDVRSAAEFSMSYIKGAKNIPSNELAAREKEMSAWRKKLIIVVCATGMRSSVASRQLIKKGFNVSSMKGGLREWEKQGLPVLRKG